MTCEWPYVDTPILLICQVVLHPSSFCNSSACEGHVLATTYARGVVCRLLAVDELARETGPHRCAVDCCVPLAAGPPGIPQLLEWDLGAALDAERAATDQPSLRRGVAAAALSRSASGQPPRNNRLVANQVAVQDFATMCQTRISSCIHPDHMHQLLAWSQAWRLPADVTLLC